MNSSTLLVSLDGIQVGSFQEVVQARGIERVIVVTDSTAFSDSAISATVSATAAVKNYVPTIEFALNSSNTLTISDSSLKAIQSAGLKFVSDSSLQSIEGSLIAQTSLLNTEGSSAEFYTFDPVSNTADQLLLEDGLSINTENLGQELSINISTTGSAPTFVSDLSSTIRVNLTAEEFGYLVANDQNALTTAVTDFSNLDIANQESLPQQIKGKRERVDGGTKGFKAYLDPANVEPAGITYYGNLTSVQATKSVVSSGGNTYMWSASGSINVEQMLALPLMGVAPKIGQTIKLIDTAANISSILPKLTDAQLASVNQIVISDDSPLDIDPNTFKRLDAADQVISYSGHDGTKVLNSDNSLGSINIVADSLAALEASKLVVNGEIVSSLDSVGDNLIRQISTFEIREIAPLTNNNLPYLTTSEFLEYAKLGANLSSNVIIKDTSENISNILWSEDSNVINLYTNIAGLVSTDDDNTIDLSWEQFAKVGGDDFETNFTSGNLFSDLVNINFTVNGTASEIKEIFDDLGESFQYLQNSISFRITDGAEVKLNAQQADALDGRLDGSFILEDDSDGIADALDKALPLNLKDISVAKNQNGVRELILTVDQFRGLPYFSNEDSVTVSDSESNLLKAINFGVLDDRVTTLNISSTSDSDNYLTVTAAQAEKLGHYKITKDNEDATILIKDRASAIALYRIRKLTHRRKV